MRARDKQIRRRGRALIRLVTRRLPREFDIMSDETTWPAVAVGLLSRMATTLESMLDLLPAGREADAATLGRSLYEHAVHFAWLAADPSERVRDWHRYDLDQRLKAEADMRRYGRRALTDAKREALQAQLAALGGRRVLKLDQLALASDRYWIGKIPGLERGESIQSFGGLYASLYRWYSGIAHPTALGLNRVSDNIGPRRRRVRVETEYIGRGPYGMATVVFGLALFIAAAALGWPTKDQIEAVFARYSDD